MRIFDFAPVGGRDGATLFGGPGEVGESFYNRRDNHDADEIAEALAPNEGRLSFPLLTTPAEDQALIDWATSQLPPNSPDYAAVSYSCVSFCIDGFKKSVPDFGAPWPWIYSGYSFPMINSFIVQFDATRSEFFTVPAGTVTTTTTVIINGRPVVIDVSSSTTPEIRGVDLKTALLGLGPDAAGLGGLINYFRRMGFAVYVDGVMQ